MTWFVFAIAGASGIALIRGFAEGEVGAFKRTFSREKNPRSFWVVMAFTGLVAVTFVSVFVWQVMTS